MREAMVLCDDAGSVKELINRLSEIKTRIQGWKPTYDVSSSNELRATIVDADLSSDEEAERRDLARTWEHVEGWLEIVIFAVREWDFLGSSAAFVEVSD